METKLYHGICKQLNEQGEGIARIATLDTRDKDGDVLRPGCCGEQTVPLLVAHQWDRVPVGKVRVYEGPGAMLADFKINMALGRGKELYSALRFDLDTPPPRAEWSFGFRVPEGGAERGMFQGQPVRFLKRLEILEVSPVVAGAGIATATLSLKADSPLDQAALAAMEARMRERAVVFHGLMALALPPPGSIGYKALPHHEVREYRALAASFVAEACAQLRTPMAAAVEVIRPARDGERADFSYEKEIGGCAGLSDRTIYVVHDLDSRALAQVCGHEAFHLAHQGGSEQEAERFGRAFRQSARGPSGPVTGRPGSKEHYEESSSVRASSPGWDRLVAAAQFVRSGI